MDPEVHDIIFQTGTTDTLFFDKNRNTLEDSNKMDKDSSPKKESEFV